jgi:flagellar biosynthesis/type III secretory pathway protein FliH
MNNSLNKDTLSPKAKKFEFKKIFEPAYMALHEPLYNQIEMEQLLSQRYQEGFAAGQTQASKANEAMIAQHLASIQRHLASLSVLQREIYDKLPESVSKICRLITEKMVPGLAEKGAVEEVLHTIDLAFKICHKTPVLYVYVGPRWIDGVKDRLNAAESQQDVHNHQHIQHHNDLQTHHDTLQTHHDIQVTHHGIQIEVMADDNLTAGECRVEWNGGGIEHILRAIQQQIDEALMRLETIGEYEKPQKDHDTTDLTSRMEQSDSASSMEKTSSIPLMEQTNSASLRGQTDAASLMETPNSAPSMEQTEREHRHSFKETETSPS